MCIGTGRESELLRDMNLWWFVTMSLLMTDDALTTHNVLLNVILCLGVGPALFM